MWNQDTFLLVPHISVFFMLDVKFQLEGSTSFPLAIKAFCLFHVGTMRFLTSSFCRYNLFDWGLIHLTRTNTLWFSDLASFDTKFIFLPNLRNFAFQICLVPDFSMAVSFFITQNLLAPNAQYLQILLGCAMVKILWQPGESPIDNILFHWHFKADQLCQKTLMAHLT